MSTVQQYRVTVSVGDRDLGVFDTKSGGEVTAESTKYRPGGADAEKSYATSKARGDITVSRVRERERDHDLTIWLDTQVGVAKMRVSEQPLDELGSPWGRPKVWTGRFTGFNEGEVNSNNKEVRMLELTMSTETVG